MENTGIYGLLLAGAVVLIGILIQPIARPSGPHTTEDILPPSADQENEEYMTPQEIKRRKRQMKRNDRLLELMWLIILALLIWLGLNISFS